ncbi:uncharacterized protein [Antedon mediterranea]|uniref:uncharacterized protein n=1 Tax=Antedon mediterranea TaxID=105859 RepID=UPI003AF96541
MADIKVMFHQFFVANADRDLLRFLWFKDNNPSNEVIEYRMMVHLFGATSSPGCSNFGLKRAAEDGEKFYGKEAANFIKNDFYVDDGLKSLSTADEAISLIQNSTGICAKAGLRLHKWISNDRKVLSCIPEGQRGKSLYNINVKSDTLPIERVLGVSWCIESDEFKFRVQLNDYLPTRRNVLKTVCSIYDPLGFIAPVLIVAKMVLQSVCAQNLDWDDPLGPEEQSKWERWCEDIKNLNTLSIPRCYKPINFKAVTAECHHFSDASEAAYGQCSYLRLIDGDGKAAVSFLLGKARVTPANKKITIPRLELNAAVVSARVSHILKNEMDIKVPITDYFWTDSKVVLGYIQNVATRYQMFVGNRVQQIHDQTDVDDWHYINSLDNPSDEASRGLTTLKFLTTSKWIGVPDFLKQDGELKCLRQNAVDEEATKLVSTEFKRSFAVTAVITSKNDVIGRIIKKFSKWKMVKIVIARLLNLKTRLITAAKIKLKTYGIMNKLSGDFIPTVDDLQVAETIIIRSVQCEHYLPEFNVLQNFKDDLPDRDVAKSKKFALKNSRLCKLHPILDESGILRVGGRIHYSSMPMEIKHPIIIPKYSPLMTLLVDHHHKKVNHMGRSATLNSLRQGGFWLIGAVSAVSQYLRKCVTCRRSRGQLGAQKMADLPIDRLSESPPFTYYGVDLFGPFIIKERRSRVKRYGVIFTCMASRAIHLESVNSLETNSFINALRRFLSIRGPVYQMRSDQGTNFVGAINEFSKVQNFLRDQQCRWILNVPSASHMGGVWERQIRTVRSALTPLLNSCGDHLCDETFRTFLCEVQSIVNSRPLTVNNLSDPTAPEALTPNHLLTMKSNILLPPPGEFQASDIYCRRRWPISFGIGGVTSISPLFKPDKRGTSLEGIFV